MRPFPGATENKEKPMQLPAQVDVLIVGAGPVGMALANLLGRYGIDTLVIDKATEIQTQPRAIALDNEALRILQMAGLAEDAFARIAIPQVRLHSPVFGEFARLNTAGSLDGHPKLVTFFQPELEQALARAAARHACVRVARGVECLSLAQETAACSTSLRLADGSTQTVAARFVVAADGASSPIRQQLGINFDGKSYAEDWLIVDALHVPAPIDHIEFLCDPRRPAPHMPAPGDRQRWEFMLHPGESREDMLRPEKVRELLAPWIDSSAAWIERTAVYRFHARTVQQFGAGRVFLAGDAAHVTPPFIGQGLVAGLRDAANLAWKLAWVVQDKARPRILASYHTERQPHARAMIRLAQWMGKLIMPRSRLAAFVAHGLARALTLTPGLRALIVDVKIKPRNRFRRGLFARGSSGSGLRRGDHIVQAMLRHRDGRYRASDEVLGDRFVLVGFGVDPVASLSAAGRAKWESVGGATLTLRYSGQAASGGEGDAWEDFSGAIVPGTVRVGTVAVVRPDKVIVTDGPADRIDELVDAACALLR
jgi:3-(3-hydroxy-phenyl)propionate hydroxylase